MRTHPKCRNSEKPRTFWRLSSVLAILVTAVAVSVSMGAARPSTSGAETWGAYGGGRLMAVDPDGGYWTTTWAGSVTPYGGAPSSRIARFSWHPPVPARFGHGGHANRARLLARGLRRRRLQLR